MLAFDVLIGADGVWSLVRKAAQGLDGTLGVVQKPSKQQYKSFTIDRRLAPWSLVRDIHNAVRPNAEAL